MLDALSTLPDAADCWIYVADRPLSFEEQQALSDMFSTFETNWSSHGRMVQGASAVVDDRVLIVAAYVDQGDISGCGIDKSLHLLDQAAVKMGFAWASGLHIVFRGQSGALEVVSRSSFKQSASDGLVTPETPVIDLSIRSLGTLRSFGLEKPASESWHARLLPKTVEISQG
ncbi:MAG: hypothetical protein OXT73_09655 [Bacteroidota bacterium]|nr:hypothetical protein [Bacteroidota bacterium]